MSGNVWHSFVGGLNLKDPKVPQSHNPTPAGFDPWIDQFCFNPFLLARFASCASLSWVIGVNYKATLPQAANDELIIVVSCMNKSPVHLKQGIDWTISYCSDKKRKEKKSISRPRLSSHCSTLLIHRKQHNTKLPMNRKTAKKAARPFATLDNFGLTIFHNHATPYLSYLAIQLCLVNIKEIQRKWHIFGAFDACSPLLWRRAT